MLTSKNLHLKKIYKFYLDHFLVKRTVFVLIEETLLKIKKNYGSLSNNTRYEKMLTSKVVYLKKICKFYFDHCLIKRTDFVLIAKNVIKNQNFNFPVKLCIVRKNVNKQNYQYQKDPPILYWIFFDRISSFRLNHEKYY